MEEALIGIIDILRSDVGVGSFVGGTGTNARVYPVFRAQLEDVPCIVVRLDNIDPSDTKDGVSTLDVLTVNVTIYSETYDDVRQLSNATRAALDRTSGTYNGEEYQSIQFMGQSLEVEEIKNKLIYYIEQDFNVRQVR